MIVLSASSLTKSYLVDNILDGISFSINHDEKIGLVGLNGAGKSTLFNILIGELSQDSGNVFIAKSSKLGYLKQQTGIDSKNTMYEELLDVFKNLFQMEDRLRTLETLISEEGKDEGSKKLEPLMNEYSILLEKFQNSNGYGFKSELKGVLKGLGFTEDQFDTPMSKLSGGEKARVALGRVLLEKPDILLLDEPTNHLDIQAIDWLEKYIRDYKGAAIVISHDRYFLDNTVSKIFHLENAQLNVYNGNYSLFMKKRKERLELIEKKFEEQQKEIGRQQEIIRRFTGMGVEKFTRQAQSRQKMLDRMNLLEASDVSAKKSLIRFEPEVTSGTDVLSVKDISKSFDDETLFENIDFNIYKGDKVGLIGPNGVGKTTLFKIIMEKQKPSTGEVVIGHKVNIGYFDQEQSDLHSSKTVIDEIWDEYPKLDHTRIRTLLAQFLFIGDDIFKEVSELSGGEKARVALLKLMLSKSNFLLMDEPTNHLDIDSKEVLEDSLLNYNGTLLVISHDRYFLNKVTDKILDLSKEGATEYLGNYNYYIEKKNALEAVDDEEEEEITQTKAKAIRKKEKDKEKAVRQAKKEVKKLEEDIFVFEQKISSLEEDMCKPEIYSDHEKSAEVNAKLLSLKEELETVYLEWMELTD